MAVTALEIQEYELKAGILGYNKNDVEALRDLAVEALASATKKSNDLEDELKNLKRTLFEHEQREAMLKDTITTAQKMVDDLKGNAKKEAELIVVEAKHQADGITRQAQQRALEMQSEIQTLKKQRIEFETKLKAILDYHMSILTIDKDKSRQLDEQVEKLKYLSKSS